MQDLGRREEVGIPRRITVQAGVRGAVSLSSRRGESPLLESEGRGSEVISFLLCNSTDAVPFSLGTWTAADPAQSGGVVGGWRVRPGKALLLGPSFSMERRHWGDPLIQTDR